MKIKQKKSRALLSDKIADALTVKSRGDIEDDQVFGTKPKTVSRAELDSSGSEDEAVISDFRKRNVNLLSDISKKYEGELVSRKSVEGSLNESTDDSDDDNNLFTAKDLSFDTDDQSDEEIQANGSLNKAQSDQSESEIESDEPVTENINKIKTNGSLNKAQSDQSESEIESDEPVTENIKKRLQSNKNHKDESMSEDDTSDDEESDDYSITQFTKQVQVSAAKTKSTKQSDSKQSNDDNDDVMAKLQKQIHGDSITKKLKSKKTKNESSSDDSENDDSITQFKKQIQGSDNEENTEESASDEEDDDDEGEGYDISQMDEPVKEQFEHVKKQNISEEVKKGNCVRNQLLLWESLLEMRIHLQRCMNTANQMPLPDTHEQLKENSGFVEECYMAKSNISNVLDKFLTLQNMLYKKFPDTKNLSSGKQVEGTADKKQDSDEEIPSDTDNEEIPSDTENEDDEPQSKSVKPNSIQNPTRKRKLEDYEKELSTSHKAFKPFRDSTIEKWNEKTRLTSANIKNTPSNTILQQVSYILSDREKLVRRTQLKRSEYEIVGFKKSEDTEKVDVNPVTKGRKDDDEYIPEIFDDSDFYHQLLRELIECKSADISDPVQLSRQWIALQQMRSKMKRKVDTKASKGRKIKYVVHNKLVNFMAPEKCTTWTDESTNELYSSLFGKMFEHNNLGLSANVENGLKIKD